MTVTDDNIDDETTVERIGMVRALRSFFYFFYFPSLRSNRSFSTFIFSVLKKAFDAFDQEKRGCISVNMVGTILNMLGHALTESMLADVIAEVDADRK